MTRQVVRCDIKLKPGSAMWQQHHTWVALSILLLLVPLRRPAIPLLWRVSCRRRAKLVDRGPTEPKLAGKMAWQGSALSLTLLGVAPLLRVAT